ncbi:short-chain dehydrogenase/reductase, partial [Gymnopus androsaceus JB14]
TYHRDTYPSISPTKPSLTQAGKTILITGGGGGIGFEIARSFAKASASKIIIVGRRGNLLDEALVKLRQEFQGDATEFIAHQADVGSDSSITSLWEFLHSQIILVHVLVLNAANFYPMAPDTLSMDKTELMEAFDTNVGGNFLMSANFVKQSLRSKELKLYLVNVSTAGIHMYPMPSQNPYGASKTAFTVLLGHIADERPVEDVQIISLPSGGTIFGSCREMALPADFSVWAASPEASWLHGRFLWAHWDVDELKADPEILRRLEGENGYLKVGVQGLKATSFELS